MIGALRPYLTYSFTLHLALVAAAGLLLRSQSIRSSPVYTIDFVGPTAVMTGKGPEAAATARPSQAPERRGREEELAAPPKKKVKLPKPSLLSKAAPAPQPEPEAQEPSEPGPKEAEAAGEAGLSPAISGAPGSGGIVTDLPNFPYPWYISQVRAALWSQWSSRMPAEEGLAVVVFTIMPDGSLVDVRVEESSGDPNFDLSAMAAAQDAGPYPPLPSGFEEPFLKVHVTLKSGT
ncbi:MAG: cell envelope integrity protein TolA [Elusimicrobia bacterium]|nr:cell envelope integrity protein TolA [Elusimicrobiota bacterium]